MDRSKDEAVRLVLAQAALPAPPMSQYIVEDKYSQIGSGLEGGGNLYDDLFDPELLKEGEQYFDIAAREGLEFDPLQFGEEGGGELDGLARDDFRADDHIDNKLASPDLDPDFGASRKRSWREGKDALSRDITDAQKEACREWLSEYGVIPGVSWGSLPKALQKEWKQSNCDQVK